MVAGYCIKLLDKHPWLEDTAFLLVGFVGAMLCFELIWDLNVQQEVNFFGISLIHHEGDHYHVKKVVKFGGIFVILLCHMTYAKYPAIQKSFRPPVIAFRTVFAGLARMINFIFAIISWPIRQLFTRSPASEAS
jgi:hypothetical protein